MPAPHHSVLQAGCPSCHPTNSVKALKDGRVTELIKIAVKIVRHNSTARTKTTNVPFILVARFGVCVMQTGIRVTDFVGNFSPVKTQARTSYVSFVLIAGIAVYVLARGVVAVVPGFDTAAGTEGTDVHFVPITRPTVGVVGAVFSVAKAAG